MKGLKVIITTIAVFLVLAIGMAGYVIGLGEGIKQKIDHFKKGQVLYPDKTHNDTLIVYDPGYLNECLNDGRLKTDGDIMEILNETCVIDITEDSTYIYDGNRFVGSMPYDSTQQFDKIMLADNL